MDSASFNTEQRKFFEICQLLEGVGTNTLRCLLDKFYPPAKLHKQLDKSGLRVALESLRRNGTINSAQWDKLYPSPPSFVTSETFDLTLLTVLLSTIFNIPTSLIGWHSLPHDSDRSDEANIVRVGYYRNMVCAHPSLTFFDDTTFNVDHLWQEISRSLIELGADATAVNNLKTEGISDPVMYNFYKGLLEEWTQKMKDIEDKDQVPAISRCLFPGLTITIAPINYSLDAHAIQRSIHLSRDTGLD